MTPDHWTRLNDLFHVAVGLDAQHRASFLAETCGDDASLRQEVEDLVAGHESAEASMHTGFLRGAVQQLAEIDETLTIGQEFGPYRIVREIGRGGMGRVFLAERADREFHRRVAIKLIKRGMDTASVIRQFRNEREILASLDHPNIARLLDAGSSKDGLPYFVMEYIEGQPIDVFCDERRYSVTERLQLFRKACGAVAYAHQHLVIHRDIKPSNILVTPAGEPKLLDFGIARLLQASAESETLSTISGLRVMTPEYASPEQILGMPVRTLTDVYSLGAVLYRLLTGASPHLFADRSPAEIAQNAVYAEPRKPSMAVAEFGSSDPAWISAHVPEGSPERLCKRLQGDLDNIIQMAMRREPERRYQSVEQFSEDIRRHLESVPVVAQQDSVSYRLQKFTARHRTGVMAGLAATLMLIAGIVTIGLEAHRARVQEQLAKASQARAERRFNEVRSLARTVLFDYHDAIKNLPGSTPVRERLVRDSLHYLDSLAAEATSDRSLSRELASAYERVADVQGGTLEANLGNTVGAIESDKKALQIRMALLGNDPGNLGLKRELATSYFKLGTLLWETGDMREAADYLRQAVQLREDLVKTEPANVDVQAELANAYDRLGMLALDMGDAASALGYHRHSLSIYTSSTQAQQLTESARRAMSVSYEHIGSDLLQLGDVSGALQNNSRALGFRAALARDFPLNSDHKRTLLVSYYNQGEILRQMGHTREALSNYRQNLAIAEGLFRADPTNEQSRGDLAYALVRVGDMLFKLGNYAEALANYKRSQGLRSADVKADAANLWKRSSLIEAEAKICKTLAAAHETAAAREPCAGALTLMQSTTLDLNNAAIRSFFADTFSDLAEAETSLATHALNRNERRRRWRSARDLYGRSREIWQDMQKRSILLQADRGKEQALSRKIAACDVALR